MAPTIHKDKAIAILYALTRQPSIRKACKAARADVQTHYNYLLRSRRGDTDLQDIEFHGVVAPYHVHVQNAAILAVHGVEHEAIDRALNGTAEDVFYQGVRMWEEVRRTDICVDENGEPWSDKDCEAFGYTHEEIYQRVPTKAHRKPSDALVVDVLRAYNKRYQPHHTLEVTHGGVLRLTRPDEHSKQTGQITDATFEEIPLGKDEAKLALMRPAKDHAELDKWDAQGDFAPRPVRFVGEDGTEQTLVAPPDPLTEVKEKPPVAAKPEPDVSTGASAKAGTFDPQKTTSRTQRANEPPLPFEAHDGRERIGYGNPTPGGFRVDQPPPRGRTVII